MSDDRCTCESAYAQTVFRCPEHGWMMCGIDGSTFPTSSPDELIEDAKRLVRRLGQRGNVTLESDRCPRPDCPRYRLRITFQLQSRWRWWRRQCWSASMSRQTDIRCYRCNVPCRIEHGAKVETESGEAHTDQRCRDAQLPARHRERVAAAIVRGSERRRER